MVLLEERSALCYNGLYYIGISSLFALSSPNYLWEVAARETSPLIAKIWIVPLSEEHATNFETGSNAILKTSAWSLPLLNSWIYLPVSVSKILINVPL